LLRRRKGWRRGNFFSPNEKAGQMIHRFKRPLAIACGILVIVGLLLGYSWFTHRWPFAQKTPQEELQDMILHSILAKEPTPAATPTDRSPAVNINANP